MTLFEKAWKKLGKSGIEKYSASNEMNN